MPSLVESPSGLGVTANAQILLRPISCSKSVEIHVSVSPTNIRNVRDLSKTCLRLVADLLKT